MNKLKTIEGITLALLLIAAATNAGQIAAGEYDGYIDAPVSGKAVMIGDYPENAIQAIARGHMYFLQNGTRVRVDPYIWDESGTLVKVTVLTGKNSGHTGFVRAVYVRKMGE